MSPDERNKINELRRKISEATKSHHGIHSPKGNHSSPRLFDDQYDAMAGHGLSSSRKLNQVQKKRAALEL